jgi:hypothetical protein
MAATSTSINPISLNRGVRPFSTAPVLGSAVVGQPGLSVTTGEYIRIPYSQKDGNMVIKALYLAHTGSTAIYPAVAIRNPPTTQKLSWRGPGTGIGTSTAESGWSVQQSTAVMTATSTESQEYVFGPFEVARYGIFAAGTSFGHVGANQSYIECVFGYSTKAAGTAMALTTNVAGTIYVQAFEVP